VLRLLVTYYFSIFGEVPKSPSRTRLFRDKKLALKILLVDPDESWLSSAKKYFLGQSYEVTSVVNGRDAQLALYNDKFFAVILNFETQNHSCSQVLKFIKTNYTNQRVIIVVNDQAMVDSDMVSEEKVIKMGALEMLVRPFELPLLKDRIEGHQSLGDLMASITKRDGVSDESEIEQADAEFTKIKIDEFYSAQAVLFNIFIKLASGRYLKILNTGDAFTKDRIDKYKNEKKVEYLYFHNSDRRKFVQYNNFLANKLIENKNVPALNKVNMLKNVTEKFIEDTYTVGMKPQVIEQGKAVCETVFNLIEKQNDLYSILRSYQNFDPNAFSHAFLVTLYSTAIIKQFDWQSKATIETTAMACMFHDIGKTLLPKEFVEMTAKDMSSEQLELYKQHPELGMKLVENNRMMNNAIKQVILQHHEAFDGTGYPYGSKGNKILTLANIVCLADTFVHIMMDEKLPPTDALKKILMNKELAKKFNSMIIERFIKVFVDPSKLLKDSALPVNSKVVNGRKAS
jgi:putative nucleotidyltransferase with HDIG domain